MKIANLLIESFLIYLLLTTASWACLNQVPESEAIRYHEAAKLGQGVPALYTCQDKPNEACLCFDQCEGWEVCEVKDVEVIPEDGEPYTERKLVNNLALLQAKRAKEDIEANHREIAKAKREQAIVKLKDFDDSKSYTVAQLKAFIKALIDKN